MTEISALPAFKLESSPSALGTMESPANVVWLAPQIMNLDFPDAGIGIRPVTLHWRNRFLSKAGTRFLEKSCHFATVYRILCLGSSLANRDYLPINLVDHTHQWRIPIRDFW